MNGITSHREFQVDAFDFFQRVEIQSETSEQDLTWRIWSLKETRQVCNPSSQFALLRDKTFYCTLMCHQTESFLPAAREEIPAFLPDINPVLCKRPKPGALICTVEPRCSCERVLITLNKTCKETWAGASRESLNIVSSCLHGHHSETQRGQQK